MPVRSLSSEKDFVALLGRESCSLSRLCTRILNNRVSRKKSIIRRFVGGAALFGDRSRISIGEQVEELSAIVILEAIMGSRCDRENE